MRTPNTSTPEPWQPRFGVGLLLLVTFVFSVMGASGYYLVQSLRSDGGRFRVVFILFTVASPLLLLVVVSVGRAVFVWYQARGR